MELAEYSHVDRVESGNMESHCMYKDGIYDIEVHTKGGFDKCAELMRPRKQKIVMDINQPLLTTKKTTAFHSLIDFNNFVAVLALEMQSYI